MSAEVEPGKDEEPKEVQQQQKKNLKQKVNDYWQIGLKLLELLMCILCIFFAAEPVKTSGLGSSHMNNIGIMFAAYAGYFLINVLLILNRFFGERLPYKTAALYSLIGSALFLITSILLVVSRNFLSKHYGYTSDMSLMTKLLISTIFAFSNCLVCVSCIAFIYDPAQGTKIGKSHLEVLGIMYTTYSSCLVINLMFFVSRFLKDEISYKTSLIFTLANVVTFVLTALMLLKAKADLQPHNFFHPNTHHLVMLITAVFLSFINAGIFFLDTCLHWKLKKNF